jgi:hypothetical protein
MTMLLTLLFIRLAFFGLSEFVLSVYGSCFLPRMHTCLIIDRVYVAAFLEIFTKADAVFLSDQFWNRIKPDTKLQIKGHKKLAHPPSYVKFCTLTPNITLLQMLYRWKLQSRKLRIPFHTFIRWDLQTPTVKEEIHSYRSQYSACLSAHPNDLVVNLMVQPDNGQLWRNLPNDLLTRVLA